MTRQASKQLEKQQASIGQKLAQMVLLTVFALAPKSPEVGPSKSLHCSPSFMPPEEEEDTSSLSSGAGIVGKPEAVVLLRPLASTPGCSLLGRPSHSCVRLNSGSVLLCTLNSLPGSVTSSTIHSWPLKCSMTTATSPLRPDAPVDWPMLKPLINNIVRKDFARQRHGDMVGCFLH